ncbi:MAG: hypothetical protein ACHQNT_07300 [Bacteroidia bacterium]
MCVCITLFNPASAQRRQRPAVGYGGGIIYNFATEGFGLDLRVKIPVAGNLSAVPEFSYFPSFNNYHEYYAGAALHYELLTLFNSYNLYVAGGGYYNSWLNADEFVPGEKKQNNFVPEAGGGLVRNYGCLRPFIEDRYDFKWKENSLRIGIYWYPRSCGQNEKCPPAIE